MRPATQPPLATRMRELAEKKPDFKRELLHLADAFERATTAFLTEEDDLDTQQVTERFCAAWRAAHKAYADASAA